MEITTSMVKALRDQTGAGLLDCRRALIAAEGDFEKAKEWLRKQGLAAAAKVLGREAKEGVVEAYIHSGGRLGVLLEVNCETDFVARTEEFRSLAHDLALQVAATNPRFLSSKDVPSEALGMEIADYGSPHDFYREVCLLEQPFIRDQGITVGDLITQAQAKFGENITIRRFVRYELGGG